jgi:hypothetical protein
VDETPRGTVGEVSVMSYKDKDLSAELVRSELTYDNVSGKFAWKKSKKGRRYSVGTVSNKGYLIIRLNDDRYLAHRLAWLYVHGVATDGELDHINGNTLDNRLINLREVSHSQNLMNSKIRSDNSTGYRGICWDNQKLKWKVQISRKGSNRLQRHFVTLAEAVKFYEKTASEMFGEFSPMLPVDGA